MTSGDLDTIEIKAYVPARDFALSIRFYEALGFSAVWASDELAHLCFGSTSFLLQDFFVQEHAQNFQMHLLVSSADEWHERANALGAVETFGAAISAVEDRPWGMRDFTVVDPSGVLWRIGHRLCRH